MQEGVPNVNLLKPASFVSWMHLHVCTCQCLSPTPPLPARVKWGFDFLFLSWNFPNELGITFQNCKTHLQRPNQLHASGIHL